MEELKLGDVKALSESLGVKVPESDLEGVTARLNGMIGLMKQLELLPLEKAEVIPTLLTQRSD